MGGDVGSVVARIRRILDVKAFFARDGMSADPPEQFGALACEHGPNYQLQHALERGLEVLGVFQLLA